MPKPERASATSSDLSWLALAAALVLPALGCDDPPDRCRGAACDDAGPDSGVDAGRDSGTDGGPDSGTDAGVDAGPTVECEHLPEGLYVSGSCSVLATNVHRFEPNYVLWSDDADKERFYSLPVGSTIDASDPDYWNFPVGTVFWKHFIRNGIRVETRMMKKTMAGTGPGQWDLRTFVWNAAQDDVTEVTNGMTNALGTDHDIPNAPEDCATCHNTPGVALGFSAIQIRNSLGDEQGRLSYLLQTNRITLPEDDALDTAQEFFNASQLPTAATATEAAALGYLHANCGNCHGDYGTAMGFSMRLWMPVGHAASAVSATPVYTTTVNVSSSYMGLQRIVPDSPSTSAIRVRMQWRDPSIPRLNQMPPLGTETPDADGLAAIDAWIDALP